MNAQHQSSSSKTVILDGSPLSIEDVVRVARALPNAPVKVELSSAARDGVAASRAVVERAIVAGDAVYGVNTGFGSLSRVRVEHARACELQRNIIRSHAAGVGEPLPREVSRALKRLDCGF